MRRFPPFSTRFRPRSPIATMLLAVAALALAPAAGAQSIRAAAATQVVDIDEDGLGDTAPNPVGPPALASAAVNVPGDSSETHRFHIEWDISGLTPPVSASVRVTTDPNPIVDTLDTLFFTADDDGNGTIEASDFETPATAVSGVVLPATTEGAFWIDVSSQLNAALDNGFNWFVMQARVADEVTLVAGDTFARGVQMRTSCLEVFCPGNPDQVVPQLVIDPPTATLNIAGAGNGNGAMADDAPGGTVSCISTAGVTSNDCGEQANFGTPFAVVATPNADSRFSAWEGCDSTATMTRPNDTCNVLLDGDRTITATFDHQPVLTVAGSGNGTGTLADTTPGGTLDCTSTAGTTSGDCSEQAGSGTAFAVVAAPNAESLFSGWDGCDSVSTTTLPDDTCHVTLEADTPITATFVSIELSLSLVPSALDFGNVIVGENAPPQTAQIENTGNADLNLGTLSVSGTNANEFALAADTCSGQVIAPTGTCTFNVTFTPAATGIRNAQIDIPSNTPESPDMLSLAGTGVVPPPELSLMPGIWDFGDVQAGDSALSEPFVVDNTGGSDLVVGMVTIEGPAAGDFQIEDDICSGQTVAPGDFCGFSVRFTPAAAGIRRAEVRVPGNAPESPGVAVLIGTQDVVFFDGYEDN